MIAWIGAAVAFLGLLVFAMVMVRQGRRPICRPVLHDFPSSRPNASCTRCGWTWAAAIEREMKVANHEPF